MNLCNKIHGLSLVLICAAVMLACVAEQSSVDASSAVATMVFIQGGCFQMGDTFGDGEPDERPVHEVCVDDFYLAEHEVTQGQWKAVMGDNPSQFQHCGDNCPVDNVSWHDAQAYIEKLNKTTGRQYRLPTEAEWEYAARDRGKAMKWAGTNDASKLSKFAWYGENARDRTHAVKTKKPNALGIYDMTGNVNEWLFDRWGKRYYRDSPRDNPKGPERGIGRDSRGGSWWSEIKFTRIANRYADDPDFHAGNHGLRLAMDRETKK